MEFVPLNPNENDKESVGAIERAYLPSQWPEIDTLSVPHFKEPDGELKPVFGDIRMSPPSNVRTSEEQKLRSQVEEEVFKITLTPREKQMLYQVRTLQMEKRMSPTCGELAKLFGYSRARAKMIVMSLVKKGFLEWSDHKSWVHKKILFPKGMTFPWKDTKQFPSEVF